MMRSRVPNPTHRLIPSRFPPIGLFDTVARADDLEAVMELAGWTNDRLVKERVARLPRDEWVFGRPNSSIVMAAFLHAAPRGGRFNGPDLGAWYAAAEVRTAIAEVGHHLRREALARGLGGITRVFRAYSARLAGAFVDVRGRATELHSATDYGPGQAFGEMQRVAGEDGVVYDSVRYRGGVNACAYRPSKVLEVVQAEHFEIAVEAEGRRIEARVLSAE
ncbi:MAG: RES family NAD+ phosphorylase [Devosia sp.]